MLAFSTCWNSHRHSEGEAMVDEITGMGFDTIEISHGLKVSLLPGLQKAFKEGRMKVCGLHNFCPSPVELLIDAPDAYEFTSHRALERARALKLTLRTLEFAAEFKARYVVLHMGSVAMGKPMKKLQELAAAGKLNSREFVKRKLAMVKKREALGGICLKRAKEALKEIAVAAEKAGVPVAVESRSHYEQVPTEREMVGLLTEFDSPWVGYWHDFGHVQLKANLGLLDHEEWLHQVAPRMLGCHFHDVIWPDQDHRVPFQGTVEYDRLLPLVRKDLPIVWELGPRRKKEDIRMAREVWLEKYGAWA